MIEVVERSVHVEEENQQSVAANATLYINAGGRGTRLNSLFAADPTFGISKALLELGQPPTKLVDHHIARAAQTPFRTILVGAGDLADVAEYIDSNYRADERVASVGTSEYQQLGTAGDLILATREHPEYFADHILVKNVDTILDIDYSHFLTFHSIAKTALSIALTNRRGVPNENAFYVNAEGRVIYTAESERNRIDEAKAHMTVAYRGSSTGAVVLDTEFVKGIDWEPEKGQISLYRDVMGLALQQDAVTGYNNEDRFFLDVGTASTWQEAEKTGVLQQHLSYQANEAKGAA